MKCPICSGSTWRPIPDVVPDRSITTAGIIIESGLGKSQCMHCGLGMRTSSDFLANTDFYEERYADYYRRPGAGTFDIPRYAAMAEWMKSALGDFRPKSILDVGCGAGWSMSEVAKVYPDAAIEGLEPSVINRDLALERGFNVYLGKAENLASLGKKYDLIYSHNVLTHFSDPVTFAEGLKTLLAPNGCIVQITVDATKPSNEFLWYDHNFSFLPRNLVETGNRAGLATVHFERNPNVHSILDKQLLVWKLGGDTQKAGDRISAEPFNAEKLFAERLKYVSLWRDVNAGLLQKIGRYDRVINFGASMWTWLLAGLCPDYWNKVDFCTVDGFEGQCIDRPVVPFDQIEWKENDCLVLGINPENQDAIRGRFAQKPYAVVGWNEWIEV